MTLVDANILMYAVGADHPCRHPCQKLLERIVDDRLDVALDAEVLQEILHRYRSIDRWDLSDRAFRVGVSLFDTVFPVSVKTIGIARVLMDENQTVMARDAVHCAVVIEHDLDGICSFDRDFDAVGVVSRFEPDASGQLQEAV